MTEIRFQYVHPPIQMFNEIKYKEKTNTEGRLNCGFYEIELYIGKYCPVKLFVYNFYIFGKKYPN